jgi:hypothetical protein
VSRTGRLSIVVLIFGIGVALIVYLYAGFMRSSPATVDFTAGHTAGQPVDLTIQTVGSIGYGAHPLWVSYLVKQPNGQWIQSTLWQLPAHTRVNVTLYQFDSGGPLRNQQLGQVTGTIGNDMIVNGKTESLVDSNAGYGVGHTFTVPTLGISVPLPANNPNGNLCAAAPCGMSSPHNTVQFSFMTPGPGEYPWQCFLPCGLGFLYGNGGPMQSIGYMDGFLKVV